jgi:hypothetical protein
MVKKNEPSSAGVVLVSVVLFFFEVNNRLAAKPIDLIGSDPSNDQGRFNVKAIGPERDFRVALDAGPDFFDILQQFAALESHAA